VKSNCDNLNKLEYKSLLADSSQLAIELDIVSKEGCNYRTWRARCLAEKAWQRHWRKTAKYNKLFGENRYIPDWYLAETRRANEHQN